LYKIRPTLEIFLFPISLHTWKNQNKKSGRLTIVRQNTNVPPYWNISLIGHLPHIIWLCGGPNVEIVQFKLWKCNKMKQYKLYYIANCSNERLGYQTLWEKRLRSPSETDTVVILNTHIFCSELHMTETYIQNETFPSLPTCYFGGMYLETRILLKVTSESYMCFAFMSFHQLLHLVLELICSNKVHTDWYSTTWKRCILLFCILLVVFGIINTLKCCHVYWAFYMLYLFCSSYILKPMILVIIVLVYFGASKDNSSLS